MLTEDMKDEMRRRRLLDYEGKIYELEMDKAACAAVGDETGVVDSEKRIEKLRLAAAAIEKL